MSRAPAPGSTVRVGGRVRPVSDALVGRVVRRVLAQERRDADVSVTFLGRDAMRGLNARFLGHDRPTDVITFALPAPDGRLAGDLYLCPWVARREASRRGVPLRQEVVRLLVHGTLHLVGWTHPESDRRTVSPMWRRQERLVAELA